MPKVHDADLIFVSRGTKERLDFLAAGVALEKRTGHTLPALRRKAVADRLALARSILKNAELALTYGVPSYRTAVSRAYYSMYHAVRALSYFANGGDDHEEHTKLPAGIPNDFPLRPEWENKLKRARLERNRADYDPYPKNDRKFEAAAKDLVQNARDLIPAVRRYLRTKGWTA